MLFYEYIADFNVALDFLDGIEISLWIILCIVLAYVGLSFIKDVKKSKMFVFMGLFFLLNIGTRIVRLISKFIVGQEYGNVTMEGPQLFLSYFYLAFTYLALFFYYIYLERDVLKKSHHFFSIMVILVIIISIINYFIPEAMIILIIPFLIAVLGVPGCYLYVAKISTGQVRKYAILMFLGLFLLLFGITLDAPTTSKVWVNVPFMPEFANIGAPSTQILGVILYKYISYLQKKR